jgi:hypothetical protein
MRTLLLVLAFASTAGAQPAPRDVDIKSTDGTLLKATYFPARSASEATRPVVVLMHMCVTNRNLGACRAVAER